MTSRPLTRNAHVFTVDVEDFAHAHGYVRDPSIDWSEHPSSIERNVDSMLDLLGRSQSRATFFVLASVAERYPGLVRRIVDCGHEVAAHGRCHRPQQALRPDKFREDARACKAALEDAGGHAVIGYRAPDFSASSNDNWALDVLLDEGYRYDSSLLPLRAPPLGAADRASAADALPVPHVVRRPTGSLVRFPLATARVGRFRIPAAGGEYFRHFPYAVTRRVLREHARSGIPGVFFIRCWEIDSELPHRTLPFLARMRHSRGLRTTVPKLQLLLADFHFTSCSRVLSEASPRATAARAPRLAG
ncbi:MAG: polysaccharide deacetylase family protein [Gemmatimonadaceae bacterium]